MTEPFSSLDPIIRCRPDIYNTQKISAYHPLFSTYTNCVSKVRKLRGESSGDGVANPRPTGQSLNGIGISGESLKLALDRLLLVLN